MPPEELRRGGPRRFPWAGNSEEKEAPLGARCLPGVLDGTVLPPFSLLFFPLLSHTVFHRRSFPFFPSVPLALACSYFYRPLYFSPSNAFPSRFDTRTRNPTARLVPSLLSRCCCAATFPFRIVALLPFYHLAEQQLVAQRGPSTGIKDLPIVLRQLRTTTYRSLNGHDQRNGSAKIDVFTNRWENNVR